MRVYKLDGNAVAKNKKVWMGLDVHKATIHATVVDREEVIFEMSIPHEPSHVRGLIDSFPGCEIKAVYESGLIGYELKYLLEELGCEAIITPSTKVLSDKGGKQIKTDSRDSKELAVQHRGGLLKEVHDHGRGHYRQRELTRTRQQFVEQRTATGTQIKSMLTYHGIEVPEEVGTRWNQRFLGWLQDEPTDNRWLNAALDAKARSYRQLTDHIKRLEDEIDRLAPCEDDEPDGELTDEETFEFDGWIALLQTVPGIGLLSAMILVLELGDILRFDNADQLASYLGLIPGEWSSGQTRAKRSMTRWGNSRARTVLVEASWTLKDKDPRMNDVYERIKARSGSGRAICAVARRLGLAIRAMIRENKAYACNHVPLDQQSSERPTDANDQAESEHSDQTRQASQNQAVP